MIFINQPGFDPSLPSFVYPPPVSQYHLLCSACTFQRNQPRRDWTAKLCILGPCVGASVGGARKQTRRPGVHGVPDRSHLVESQIESQWLLSVVDLHRCHKTWNILEPSLICPSHHILQGTPVVKFDMSSVLTCHVPWILELEGKLCRKPPYLMNKTMVSIDFLIFPIDFPVNKAIEWPPPSWSLEELSGRSLRTASRASQWIQIPSMRETWRCWGNAPGSRCGEYIFRTFRAGCRMRNLKKRPQRSTLFLGVMGCHSRLPFGKLT